MHAPGWFDVKSHPSVRDIVSYCRELGWRDPLVLPDLQDEPQDSGAGVKTCTTLKELAALIDGCDRCALVKRRKKIVFGAGNPSSTVLFIGEAPGADEDKSGQPFVGRSGALLDRLIFALGLERQDVYITNTVKCRPPGNRNPEEIEMAACSAFLDRQIELIKPSVIVSLGKPAAHRLLGTGKSMGSLRGRWTRYRGIPLMPLYHPAYLLRTPLGKRETWADIKAIRAKLNESAETP